MDQGYVIALDTHCAFTEAVVMTATGRVRQRVRLATKLPDLRQLIEGVRRPRHVVLEEGSLAGWLVRELRGVADVVTACDPRRNAHIAKDGDKDEPIDAEKLGHLYRGGYVRAVHHSDDPARVAFKQLVALYHDRVRNVVRHANRLSAQFRQYGVFVRQADFAEPAPRVELLRQIPSAPLRDGLRLLFEEFDCAQSRRAILRRMVVAEARAFEPVRRFVAVPGVQWIRAATFFAYVDTPWRFATKAALWRYMGIGLERRRSGGKRGRDGRIRPAELRLCVPPPQRICRPLKSMILGAAQTVIQADLAPFAQQYKEQRHAGVSPRNARRSLARRQSATLRGMFKSGSVYHPEWVGVVQAAASWPAEPPAAG